MSTTTYEPGAPVTPPPPPPPPSRWFGPIRVITVTVGVGLIGLGVVSTVAQFATRVETTTKTVDEAVTALRVDVGAGDVSVRAGAAGDPIRIETTTRSAFRTAGHSETVQNGVLVMRGSCSGGIPIDNCQVSYELVVPRDVTVDLKTGSGDQSVVGMSEAAVVRAGSGDIRIRNVTGAVQAQTGSGDIRLDAVVGDVLARAGSGDIEGRNLRSDRNTMRTGSGDVDVAFSGAPSAVTAKAGSGDLHIRVPRDGATYDVTGGTGSGDRHIEVPTGSTQNRIQADTGSGDVHVEFT